MPELVLTIRELEPTDIVALGSIALDALMDAPSSVQEFDEVPGSPLILGEEISNLDEPGLRPLVAETSDELAGFAAFERRSMARSHHVVEVRLLVHPQARGQGIGRQLMRAVNRKFAQDPGVGKLVMIVAADDDALLKVVQDTPGWVIEQRATGAWARDDHRVDVESWANLEVGA